MGRYLELKCDLIYDGFGIKIVLEWSHIYKSGITSSNKESCYIGQVVLIRYLWVYTHFNQNIYLDIGDKFLQSNRLSDALIKIEKDKKGENEFIINLYSLHIVI